MDATHPQGGAVAPEAIALRNLCCVIVAALKWSFTAFMNNTGIKNTPRLCLPHLCYHYYRFRVVSGHTSEIRVYFESESKNFIYPGGTIRGCDSVQNY